MILTLLAIASIATVAAGVLAQPIPTSPSSRVRGNSRSPVATFVFRKLSPYKP